MYNIIGVVKIISKIHFRTVIFKPFIIFLLNVLCLEKEGHIRVQIGNFFHTKCL